MSEETLCFEASLYVDGQKVSRVSNSGQGGEQRFDAPWSTIDPVNDWCKANLPKWGGEFVGGENDTDLSLHISDLINRFSILKEYKKLLRTKMIFLPKDLKGDSYRTMAKPKFGSVAGFNAWVQTMVRKHPKYYVLNALPVGEAENLWVDFHFKTQERLDNS